MKRKFLIVACIFAAISMASCKAQNVDVADAASYIRSLTKDSKVVVTGNFPNNSDMSSGLLYGMNLAIVDCGHKVELDLSNTTGLTNLESSSAFRDCTGLTSITIPDSVTEIGDSAFDGCSGLERISVSAGNKVYDSRNNCNAIIETSSNRLISGCKNTVIPDNVTEIGDYAFSGCTGLTSITIPDSLTAIGGFAFDGCSGLERISVSAGNKVYDSRNNCNAIIETSSNRLIFGWKNTVIPDSVTGIGVYAFSDCTELTSITIPDSVTEIGEDAFDGCSGLERISVSAGNKVYDSRNNCNAIIETSSNTLIRGCKNTVIPDSVTEIGDYAFSDCTGLTSIAIPDSVTETGRRAFYGCSGLERISVSAGNKVYDSRNNCNAIIETSSNRLISGCKNTVIPDSVTEIGESAFIGCTELTDITISGSVSEIGWRAFGGCSGLERISVSAGNKVYDSRDDCNAIIETSSNKLILGCKNTVIPGSVTKIGKFSFDDRIGFTDITIPDGVTEIGQSAFFRCANLKSIKIPDSVTEIGYLAFSGCTSLTSVTIPSSVTTIEDGAFSQCFNLKNIKISEGVTQIGQRAFAFCTSLESVTIPNSVTEIGTRAFSCCTSIKELSIPDNVLINFNAFLGCENLQSVTISDGVRIDRVAFADCPRLERIIVPKGSKVYDSRNKCNAVIETASDKLILGCKNTVIPDSVTEIGDYAFSGCTELTSITIPDNVMEIGNYAFSDCTGLTSITIPDSLTAIGGYAFGGCSGLERISVSAGNKVYDSRNNCNAIIEKSSNRLISGCKNTVIPDSVTEIGEYAFYGCSSLEYINASTRVIQMVKNAM